MPSRKDPALTGKLYSPVPVSTPEEEWRDVVGYEGRYLVSSKGRLYSLYQECFIRPRTNRGYKKTALSVNGKRKEVVVHTLVASAFLGPCPEGKEPNHKNGIKTDNSYTNLEYVTHPENITHAWRSGLRKIRHGIKVLSDEEIREVRRLWNLLPKKVAKDNQGGKCLRTPRGSLSGIALRFGICPTHVRFIGQGKCWANLR